MHSRKAFMQTCSPRSSGYSATQAFTHRRRRTTHTTCAIKARWCIDIKYGVKMEALALLQEWIQSVGSAAGLNAENTSLTSGAVGVPESRLELEVEFETLAEVEGFWAAIPPAEHKAWSQRAQNYIVDGSPRWELLRTCAIYPGSGSSKAAAAILNAWKQPARNTSNAQPLQERAREKDPVDAAGTMDELSEEDERPKTKIVLDWKGDPMTINPGDKMPLF